MSILVLNVGSSSVKFATFAQTQRGAQELSRGQCARAAGLSPGDAIGGDDLALVAGVLDAAEREDGALEAVGHRIVHGGRAFFAPVTIDAEILSGMAALAPLAPLHQPHNLMGVRAVAQLRPGLPQVACFDTSFHRTQPELHRRLPLPENFFDEGIERYGFHGLSYTWLAQEIARLRGAAPKRMLAFHLGAGSSACAILDGRSHDTSMGFSTIDGLMMATRPGALDAGVVLHLVGQGATLKELNDLFYTRSGLRGVSGLTADMKTLLDSNEASAARAIDMFCRRAAVVGAGLAVSLGGLDAIVFTGGIGEHAPAIRAKIAAHLALLGASVDETRNARNDARISPDGAGVECWIVKADEERVIAEAVAALV
ncbi:MAG: acetate kinase [Rhodoblastus sp.]